MSEPQYPDLVFPLAGVDQAGEYGQQRTGTTPTGTNVRGRDPRTGRRRGGTRPGLSKYAPVQVDGTSTLIQHLNVIVDPTTEALLVRFVDDYGIPGGDGKNPNSVTDDSTNTLGPDPSDPDYRNPGRPIPDGGSGVDLSPDQPPQDDGEHGWTHIQHRIVSDGSIYSTSHDYEIPFDDPTTKDQLIVVVVGYAYGENDSTTAFDVFPTVTVTDSLGNSYTGLTAKAVNGNGGLGNTDPFTSGVRIFYAVNQAGGACTVTVTIAAGAGASTVRGGHFFIGEFGGLENASPYEAEDSDVIGMAYTASYDFECLQNAAERLHIVAIAPIGLLFINEDPENYDRESLSDAADPELFVYWRLSTPIGTDAIMTADIDLQDKGGGLGDGRLSWVTATFRYGV